jgi:AcrR family transcriptional regulator
MVAGLRERKKQQTREGIAEAAVTLFAERGFDSVPVAEIAERAYVSEATVYNYFPTKEDLIYQGLESYEEQLLAAIRERRADQSIPQAFRAFVLRVHGLLAAPDPAAIEALVVISRIIADSPVLLARENTIHTQYTRALAALIAEEVGAELNDIEPQVVATALVGVHRALVEHVRAGLLAGTPPPRLARSVRTQASRAFATLERGLATYAPA